MLERLLRKYLFKYGYNKYFFFMYHSGSVVKTIVHPWFWLDYFRLKKTNRTNKRFHISVLDLMPILQERTDTTRFDAHYVYHVAWAMRKVKFLLEKKKIRKHIDFSSSLHFCSNLSAFIPVEFYDYRPAELTLSALKSGSSDLTDLKNFPDSSVESLSCMHVIEHIGLGRYGDPVDVDGDIKAIHELKRIVKKGGSLLFVTPVGEEKIVFNAHRIYAFDSVMRLFGKGYLLKEFSLVTDSSEFLNDLDLKQAGKIVGKQKYGCGCFWFIRKH